MKDLRARQESPRVTDTRRGTPDPYATPKRKWDFPVNAVEWLFAAILAAFVLYAAVRAWAG